jgi:phosphoenolpyruvate carboxykinase (GTP)
MGDYFAHWLAIGTRLTKPPRIFRVNWFRRDADGRYLWPGYGENVRILKWMVQRIRGEADVDETPIGWIPARRALDLDGLDLSSARLAAALSCDAGEWLGALEDLDQFYGEFGPRMPPAITRKLSDTRRRLGA